MSGLFTYNWNAFMQINSCWYYTNVIILSNQSFVFTCTTYGTAQMQVDVHKALASVS